MPRQARIDVPGEHYHVMSRGIERGTIFLEEEDYADFIERFNVWLKKTGGKCLSWCLIPNHFHFLVLRGARPLSELMHHVLTGYAVNYNLRRRRCGHLFQNRYKAIICGYEGYFMELVPYIHLNPLRAGLVKDLEDLAKYKWCGHAALAAGTQDGIIDKQALLPHFGGGEAAALGKYMAVMEEKAREIKLGAASARRNGSLRAFKEEGKLIADQDVPGKQPLMESAPEAASENFGATHRTRAELLSEASRRTGIPCEEILRPSRNRAAARARAVYCFLCKEEAGSAGGELMAELGIGQSGISKLVSKGRGLLKPGELGI